MNPVPFILLVISLPLLLGGCGEKIDGVNAEEVEDRDGIAYLKGSDTPYTGKVYGLHENGQKWIEANYKDGKEDGLEVRWHGNGKKESEKPFRSSIRGVQISNVR